MALEKLLSFFIKVAAETRRGSNLRDNLKSYVYESVLSTQSNYSGRAEDLGFRDMFYSNLSRKLSSDEIYRTTDNADLQKLFNCITYYYNIDDSTRFAITPVIKAALINASDKTEFEFEEELPEPSRSAFEAASVLDIYPGTLETKLKSYLQAAFETRLLKQDKKVHVAFTFYPAPYEYNFLSGIRFHVGNK